MLNGKVILVTGGTGSFGRKFTELVFRKYKPTKLIVFSRDEFKQHEMAKFFPPHRFPALRFFLGDVRDKERLRRAFEGVDYIVHAAALKQVPALEYNPMEAVKTNVIGANNIVDAAIDSGVAKVVALSTDKAVNPINLYGASKLVAEKIFVGANAYAGNRVRFSVIRYGNVVGSRGSVIPVFLGLRRQEIKEFPITDERMTRFWITLEQSAELAITALEESVGGEIFVPKIPSMKIVDLARAIEPKASFKTVGIRPGEKLHEVLITEDDQRSTRVYKGIYVILPQFDASDEVLEKYKNSATIPAGFIYKSDKNDSWLKVDDLKRILEDLESEPHDPAY